MCKRMADSDNDNDNDNDNANVIIPRHVPSNPYNYTNVQLAERKRECSVRRVAAGLLTSHLYTRTTSSIGARQSGQPSLSYRM